MTNEIVSYGERFAIRYGGRLIRDPNPENQKLVFSLQAPLLFDTKEAAEAAIVKMQNDDDTKQHEEYLETVRRAEESDRSLAETRERIRKEQEDSFAATKSPLVQRLTAGLQTAEDEAIKVKNVISSLRMETQAYEVQLLAAENKISVLKDAIAKAKGENQ
jgi:hypothetical protein